MRMLNTGSSAWGVRVRMAIYAKGDALERQVEFMAPAGSLNRPIFTQQYRFGRVPTLWFDDGTILQESEAIMEFIDELVPDPPLKPDDILDRARMRMIVRLADDGIVGPLKVLFVNRDPQRRDATAVARALESMADGFDRVEHYLDDGGFAVGDRLTLADCTLVPAIWLVEDFRRFFAADSPLERRPKCAFYWSRIPQHPVVRRIIPEMRAHLDAARAARIAAQESGQDAAPG